MIFAATFACARCRLRFTRRSRCPSCDGAEIFSLGTREGRTRYRVATRTGLGSGQAFLLRLAPWAPRRLYIPIAFAILAMAPAAIGLYIGPHMFQDLWIMDDLTTKYEGLSYRGFAVIMMGIAGALLLAFTLLAKLGSTLGERVRAGAPARMRVFVPSDTKSANDTTLTGIARRATVEITSPLSDEPCLVFGIEGEVGDADIADADGGDFDLELTSGERVMISLEHAMVTGGAPERPKTEQTEVGSTLDELLENRAIIHEGRTPVLEEHMIRDGDTVTVTGKVLGGTVTSLGYRGSPRTRVLAGDDENPLVIVASPLTPASKKSSRAAS